MNMNPNDTYGDFFIEPDLSKQRQKIHQQRARFRSTYSMGTTIRN